MKYIEEDYARDLHSELDLYFASIRLGARLSLDGAGVHWGCTAGLGERTCEINCFHLRADGSGAEYLALFNEGGQTTVWGRTNSKQDTVVAASNWLQGSSLDELKRQFDFVDRQMRSLLMIVEAVVYHQPILAEKHEVQRVVCDLCTLRFAHRDRSCTLSYYGKNEFADARFHWDECELFRFRAENLEKLAAVLMRWLCDEAKPSEMRIDFPWIEIGELADYYENGKPIEGEFVMSWNSIERFYSKLNFPLKEQVLNMIREMRQRCYDKTLRAGQSLFSFILSRSRRHGLRANQPHLAFSFKESSMEVTAHFGRDETFSMPQIAFSPQVDALLQRLLCVGID